MQVHFNLITFKSLIKKKNIFYITEKKKKQQLAYATKGETAPCFFG